jgi:hypothetical protein
MFFFGMWLFLQSSLYSSQAFTDARSIKRRMTFEVHFMFSEIFYRLLLTVQGYLCPPCIGSSYKQ